MRQQRAPEPTDVVVHGAGRLDSAPAAAHATSRRQGRKTPPDVRFLFPFYSPRRVFHEVSRAGRPSQQGRKTTSHSGEIPALDGVFHGISRAEGPFKQAGRPIAHRVFLTAAMLTGLLVTSACGVRDSAPGRPAPNSAVIPPNKITDFNRLYASNCSGCHGQDGKGGIAIGLGDSVYLAIADDATIRRVTADGVNGTSMPAFAQHSGGMLTDDQVEAIVNGIRRTWAKPDALGGANAPPYGAQTAGDPKRGMTVYATYCSSCHGADGKGGKQASSIVDGSYLGLVSDQNLRTTVIAGRPELGAPDWRGDLPGKPMTPEDVSDVVAWLAAQRPQFPGQPYSSAQLQGGIR